MKTARDDLVELSDHAWQRLRTRLAGLTDDEYSWQPSPGVSTLGWRLRHIVDTLREDRNGPWLGLPATSTTPCRAANAADILSELDGAYRHWRGLLAATSEQSLSTPIGAPAGRHGTATRRSFVLHILDELIHHAAEVALLRDLHPS